MAIEPVTHLEKTIAGTVEPVTHLEKVIEQYGGGGGGSVTVDAELSTSSENPVQNKAITAMAIQFLDDLGGKADKETTVTVSGTTPTITPIHNRIYNCGEVESLTISNPPATGKYSIVFFSGATPTATVGIENFAAEANKRYKITVEGNYATYDSWPYTPT